MEFLREIDSPIPAPLRVAADVTLTRAHPRRHASARARATVKLDEAEKALLGTVELARRLGAHLHVAPVRRDVEAIVGAARRARRGPERGGPRRGAVR